MTLARWLDERRTAVPPRLAARLDEALSNDRDVDGGEATKVCVEAADALLRNLLARPSAGRDVALDLLTVDALATYAFEAAAANPTTLRERAAEAAARFAAAAHD
jgi:hypothetical protein